MAANVVRLRTKPDRLREADAAELRQLVLEFGAGRGVSERSIAEIVAAVDAEAAAREGWTFVMISPEANSAVLEWLLENARRPKVAVRLWGRLFMHLRRDTGEIVLTRAELAEAARTSPDEVSRIMAQLEGVGAIITRRDGRGVRYLMSAKAGTHLVRGPRERAQAAAPPLRVVEPA